MERYHDNLDFGICREVLVTLQLSPEPDILYLQAHDGMLGNSCALYSCNLNIRCGHLDTKIYIYIYLDNQNQVKKDKECKIPSKYAKT